MKVHVRLRVVSSRKVHGGRCWRLVAKYRCGPGLAVWIALFGNLDGRDLDRKPFFSHSSLAKRLTTTITTAGAAALHGHWDKQRRRLHVPKKRAMCSCTSAA